MGKSEYVSKTPHETYSLADATQRAGFQAFSIVRLCIQNNERTTSKPSLVGWVAWALPTNLLMQKFPLNKYLAINVRLPTVGRFSIAE